MEQRVQEDGASKRCSVIEQIEGHPLRESGQTSIWSFITKTFDKR